MSKPRSTGPFSSSMPMDFPDYRNGANGGSGDNGRGPGRKGAKHRNHPRDKSHKQNGQGEGSSSPSSKEQTPMSPPPEDKNHTESAVGSLASAEDPEEIKIVDIESPISTASEQRTTPTPQWDTTEDDFVTANNSAEESGNGLLESLPTTVPSEPEDSKSDTSVSGGTLTPNNSVLLEKSHDTTLNEESTHDNDVHVKEDQDSEDDEEDLTNASLAVHLSDTVGDPSILFQSFISGSLDTTPSSTPHPPPPLPSDLSTISEQEQSNSNNASGSILLPNQFQTSTPILSNTASSRRTVSGGTGGRDGGEMNFTTGEDPSTIYHGESSATMDFDQDHEVEDPTPSHVSRANRGYNNTEDFRGFGLTHESGICDMSTPSKEFKNTMEGEEDLDTDVVLSPVLSAGDDHSNDEVAVESNNSTFNHEVPLSAVRIFEQKESLEVPVSLGHGHGETDLLSEGDEEVEEINKPFLLPSTVTELTAANGVKVYVVGTAHFSRQSQLDVIETLEKVQPTIIVLELCRSRSGMLAMNEEQIMKEAADMSIAKISATIRQSGPIQGLLHVLLLQMTASLTKKLGMAPGGEFRVAVQEGRKIPGCMIHFGDRQLSITLQRALSGLAFFQKVRLAWHFLKANETEITKEEVEACKEKDLLEKLLVEMAGEFPSITKVLLDERDLYLANSLWQAATSTRIDRRTGTIVPNSLPIVGVVGMGHVAGIVRNWGPIDQDKLEEILEIPPAPLAHLIIGKVVKFSCYGILGLILYKGSRKVFSFPSDDLISSVAQKASTALQQVKNHYQ